MGRLIIDSENMRAGVEGMGVVADITGWVFVPGFYPDVPTPHSAVPIDQQVGSKLPEAPLHVESAPVEDAGGAFLVHVSPAELEELRAMRSRGFRVETSGPDVAIPEGAESWPPSEPPEPSGLVDASGEPLPPVTVEPPAVQEVTPIDPPALTPAGSTAVPDPTAPDGAVPSEPTEPQLDQEP